LREPLDISLPISAIGPRAWYVQSPIITPVIDQQFRGSVALGGSVNFFDIHFNPHGHGTHTETMGHISSLPFPISEGLNSYHSIVRVISVNPELRGDDRIITYNSIKEQFDEFKGEAILIRTLPNDYSKKTRNYSDTNFPYFEKEVLLKMAEKGIVHFLTDLPSVDREHDEGLLQGHKAFWSNCSEERRFCTITEFVFVPDEIEDGDYLLNLQVASFDNDAAPSRPVLYRLMSS
jgi:kynurenine formamidase